MATSHGKLWKKKSFQLGIGETASIDTLLPISFNQLEYILNFNNDTNNLKKSLNMSVQKTDSDVVETIYSRLGELSVSVVPKVIGAEYKLEITNNEAFAIEGTFARALL